MRPMGVVGVLNSRRAVAAWTHGVLASCRAFSGRVGLSCCLEADLFRNFSRFAASVAFAVLLLVLEVVCLGRALLEKLRGRAEASGNSTNARLKVLTIGSFYNANWYRAHLSPLADASAVEEVRVVSGAAGEPIPKVRWCVAPAGLRRLLGMNLGRALVAAREAMTWKPDIIIGYFIFPSAILSLLLARLIGVKAAYQMCGGPLEIVHCGSRSENPILTRVFPRFPGLERMLFRQVNRFDLVVVRGSMAQSFCQKHFPHPIVQVLTAGINGRRFHVRPDVQKRYDLIAVSRVSGWKRLDVMIQALARLAPQIPSINAIIVGEGPETQELQALSWRLGVQDRIHFAGKRDDVEELLAQSRVFVLPSSSEGLSIAMVEAMVCGLPAVVSDVGELGELVRSGRNGYLVPAGDVDGFARAIGSLLQDPLQLAEFGARASEDAHRLCAAPVVSEGWSQVLTQVASRGPATRHGSESVAAQPIVRQGRQR